MDTDPIDVIREQLEVVYPDLDTHGLAVTGRLLRLARRIEESRGRRLEAFGLTPADLDVLATLRRHPGEDGCNPRTLQRSVMISSGGMTKRLDRLERSGLIRRGPDPDDRRGVRITLTDRGRALVDRALPAVLTAERDDLAEAMGATRDRDRLADLLRRLSLARDAPPA